MQVERLNCKNSIRIHTHTLTCNTTSIVSYTRSLDFFLSHVRFMYPLLSFIYGSFERKSHSECVTYKRILRWNNAQGPKCNPTIIFWIVHLLRIILWPERNCFCMAYISTIYFFPLPAKTIRNGWNNWSIVVRIWVARQCRKIWDHVVIVGFVWFLSHETEYCTMHTIQLHHTNCVHSIKVYKCQIFFLQRK